jgi:predicted house-cleaning noncanonical NTP pyrophosphatase (MazG superfamily)
MSYKKLVRDKIPEIIQAKGQKPITRILDEQEHLEELIKKLAEEYEEFKEAVSLEELADIQEVVHALAEAIGATKEELEKVRAQKAEERGKFEKRIYLEGVE